MSRHIHDILILAAMLEAVFETPPQREARKARELIDFAKTGAPPALDERKWVDESPTYSAVERSRRVPRMFDQKPWVDPVKDPRTYDVFCESLVKAAALAHGFTYDVLMSPAVHQMFKRPANLNDFAREIHAANHVWWHDPVTGEKLKLNFGERIMLTVSEIAECMEGERRDLMDDHLPHRKMAEVELADAALRLADIAGEGGYILGGFNPNPAALPENKAQALLRIARMLTKIPESPSKWSRERRASQAFALIEGYALKHGYDLWGAIAEKREYNKHRADHKPAARAAANGKKF